MKYIFFLIFHVFFRLISYHPGFYSSLSDKKQRNDSISKMFPILVNLAKIFPKMLNLWSKIHFCIRLGQILPILQEFLKCRHFFAFYRSVSCKNQDDREWNRKIHGISRKIYFIDFLILFCFADFFLKNPSNVTPNPCKLWKKGSVSEWIFLVFQVGLVTNQIIL